MNTRKRAAASSSGIILLKVRKIKKNVCIAYIPCYQLCLYVFMMKIKIEQLMV